VTRKQPGKEKFESPPTSGLESEGKYRALFEYSPDGILISDMDTKGFLYANPAICEMLGYDTEELTGMAVSDIHPKDKLKHVIADFEMQASGRKRLALDIPLLRKDGSILYADVNTTKILLTGRECLVGFFRDITERKKLEEELRAALLHTRTLIEASLDPLVTISPEGKITDVNEATTKVTGVSRERLIGTDFSSYFTEPEKARLYQTAFEKGVVINYPLTIRHTSGKLTDVLYNASVYTDETGNVLGVFAAARDITERKQAEEKLRETMKELERSNAELERFAYVASHDLQEPLRMVASYTQLLEKRYKDRLDRDAHEFIDFAVDGAKRMQQLINDLLAYSRVGTRGKTFEATDCEAVLNAAIANLDVAIRESKAKVTHDPLPAVMADEGQLVQLFQNLIGNGIKFHGKKLPCVHVSAKPNGDKWVFSVKDNGIGIDPQYYERIFIIFQRLHGEEYPGSGTGLAIAKRIVERHGGRIWIESQPDIGTTFHFTMPFKGEK